MLMSFFIYFVIVYFHKYGKYDFIFYHFRSLSYPTDGLA
jgi:hypothetical protein